MPPCQEPLECGSAPPLRGADPWCGARPCLTNNAVNALATATGAVLGATLGRALAGGGRGCGASTPEAGPGVA